MYQYKAAIVRVIDGDTTVMDVDLGFYIWLRELHIRFVGINAPEKSDNAGWTKATDRVKEFFAKYPLVTVNIYGQDKYGRWLGEIVDPSGGTLNQHLVDEGLAKVY